MLHAIDVGQCACRDETAAPALLDGRACSPATTSAAEEDEEREEAEE